MYEEERDIIDALREGKAPEQSTGYMLIGRKEEMDEFKRLLKDVKRGKAVTKFINAQFGMGKSLLLRRVEEIAIENNFVVSYIDLPKRAADLPFNKFEIVYTKIVQGLRSKSGRSFKEIIDAWLLNLKNRARDELDNPLRSEDPIIIKLMNESLEPVREHSNAFTVVLESYYLGLKTGNDEKANSAIAWLEGDPNMPANKRKEIGVKGTITKEESFNFLKALTIFIKSIGYLGLVVLIDEAENIMNLTTGNLREGAYGNIKALYDNEHGLENIIFIFAGTPQLFQEGERKGIGSYDALYERIKDVLHSPYKNIREPVIELEGLKRDELREVSKKIIEMHTLAYDWDPRSRMNPVLEDILNYYEERAGLSGGKVIPRDFIRAFVDVLDTIEQHPDITEENILGLFEEKESEWEL
ncbi:MAG: hypothetical protein MASP_00562 [Candidatus Methanolliviera sp. GoM_asphalt]|nr:MAG: hypothetical protein MASP_00562 [Candidatus Methanolliviera sp. GoM_asphalt]